MEDYDDLSFCNYIEDVVNKNICYKKGAEYNLDSNACNFISDIKMKNECIEYIELRK